MAHRPPIRTVVVTFPCRQCGEPAQWSFPSPMLDESGLHNFGAQCTRCGHRVVCSIEVCEPEPEIFDLLSFEDD